MKERSNDINTANPETALSKYLEMCESNLAHQREAVVHLDEEEEDDDEESSGDTIQLLSQLDESIGD